MIRYLTILFPLMTIACEEKTKTVYVDAGPWYQNTYVRTSTYGEANILPLVSDPCTSELSYSGVRAISTGEVIQTIEDYYLEYNSEGQLFPTSQDYQSSLESDHETFSLCDESFSEETVNYVAVQVASNISASYDWYNASSSVTIPEIRVDVQSVHNIDIYERIKESEVYESKTHINYDDVYNAYWSIDTENLPYISFLPHHSSATIDDDTQIPMWDLPFVARHEFGHHVFANHMAGIFDNGFLRYGEKIKADRLSLSTHAGRNNRKLLQSTDVTTPMVGNYELINALNEGVADLFAYYSSNELMEGIDLAPCFTNTRDPGSATMVGWLTSKVWTTGLIHYIFDPTNSDALDDSGYQGLCGEFELSYPHGLGAIIAHGVESIFDNSSQLDSTNDASIKTTMLINWLDSLNDNLDFSESGPKQILSLIFNYAATAAEPGASYSTAFCDMVQEKFAGWESDWKANTRTLATCFP